MRELRNQWIPGNRNQWIFSTFDNHSLTGLGDKVDINQVLIPPKDDHTNLGIHKFNNQLYSSNDVGVCRLKGVDGKNIISYDGKEIILKIEPRFSVSVVKMLDMIKEDDEFERYLAPQTVRLSSTSKDVEDLQSNEVFHFFDKESPIFIKDNISRDSSIITATVFISMLKDLCKKPLIGKMVSTEENLVGKVKGKIVFHKNIHKNMVRGRNDRLYCRYLRYSEDVIENQILKAALHKASLYINSYFGKVDSKENSYKEMVVYCQKALEKVSSIGISQHDLSSLKVTGCYAYYKPVLAVAKMVLKEISLESNGNSKTTSYVVPYSVAMNKLFEMYVRAYLKHIGIKQYDDETPGIHIEKYDYKTRVLRQRGAGFAAYINGTIKPDILLYDSVSGKKVVFDVKYKNIDRGDNARDDRLQLLAYTLMYNCNNVGIIAPGDSEIIYYEKNPIDTFESKTRFYHQIRMAISEEWVDFFKNKDDSEIMALNYIMALFRGSI